MQTFGLNLEKKARFSPKVCNFLLNQCLFTVHRLNKLNRGQILFTATLTKQSMWLNRVCPLFKAPAYAGHDRGPTSLYVRPGKPPQTGHRQ